MNTVATKEDSAEQPAEQWRISPSRDQMEVPKGEQTHTRRMPLPFTIDAWIMGRSYERLQYLGHGYSKVCYSLTETLVLKLRSEDDQEPRLFRQLEATGVYPKVHAASTCEWEGKNMARVDRRASQNAG